MNKTANNVVAKYTVFFSIFVCLICFSACSPVNQTTPKEKLESRFQFLSPEPFECTVFRSFDLHELQQQIPNYSHYYAQNKTSEANLKYQFQNYKAEIEQAGEYLVGTDLEAGLYLYIAQDTRENDFKITSSYTEQSQNRYSIKSPSFVLLKDNDKLTVVGSGKLITSTQIPPIPATDNMYYTGAYRVGTDIPSGRYFALTTNTFHGGCHFEQWDLISSEKPYIDKTLSDRFCMVTIPDTAIYINLQAAILIPWKDRPKVQPISHQGFSSPVYGIGSYEIGSDIPLGTYELQNELFNIYSAQELDQSVSSTYKGHPDALINSENDAKWSACSLYIEDLSNKSNDYIETIEIDNRMKNYIRFARCYNPEREYMEYNGLPHVTFTEEDRGKIVSLDNVILHPTTSPSEILNKYTAEGILLTQNSVP